MKGCVTIKEMQEHMRNYFRKQRQIRQNHSKPFTPKPISNIQEPRETIDMPVKNNNKVDFNQPPTFNYNIFNTAPKVNNQPQNKTKDFDIGLFLILISIVAVFLVAVDSGIRRVTQDLYHKGIGKLYLVDTIFIGLLRVLVIVLIVYLISKRK